MVKGMHWYGIPFDAEEQIYLLNYLFFGNMKWYQIIFVFTFQYPDYFLLIWVISVLSLLTHLMSCAAQEVIYIKNFVMLEKF